MLSMLKRAVYLTHPDILTHPLVVIRCHGCHRALMKNKTVETKAEAEQVTARLTRPIPAILFGKTLAVGETVTSLIQPEIQGAFSCGLFQL